MVKMQLMMKGVTRNRFDAGLRNALFLFACALSVLPTWVAAATASLDRPVMREGESVQLIVEGNDGEPDFSVLADTFDVLSTSKSSHVNIVNGRMDARTRWLLTLLPKHDGDLILPAIRVGREDTKPIPLRVLKSADATTQGGGAADVFLEVSATPKDPYVQGQIVYSMRLFSAGEIADGSLSTPTLANAVIERLGEDVRYQAKRNGRDYQVTERRFAIFPQRNGSVEIAPTVFNGQLIQHSGGVNPFADPFSGFFGQPSSRPIRMRSEGILLNVRPKPANATNPWLPAQSLTLKESWSPANPQFRVGESITRTIRIEAMGLTGAQLPPHKMPDATGVKFYADQPVVESQPTPEGVTGVRHDKVALVPSRPGPLTLPEIRVDWWDTATGTPQTALIPARLIDVLPAADAQMAPEQSTSQPAMTPPKAPETPTQGSQSESAPASSISASYWPWIAAFAGFGWLLTGLIWFTKSRRTPRLVKTTIKAGPSKDQLDAIKQKIRAACQRGNAQEAKMALLDWGKVAWPERPISNLADLAEQLGNPSAQTAFAQLNAILYAKRPGHWESMAFWEAVGPHLQLLTRKVTDTAPVLPPLHPRTA